MKYQEALDKAVHAANADMDVSSNWLAIARELREAAASAPAALPVSDTGQYAAMSVELGKLRTRYAALIQDLEGIVATQDGMIRETHLDAVIRIFKDGS